MTKIHAKTFIFQCEKKSFIFYSVAELMVAVNKKQHTYIHTKTNPA